MLVAPIDSSMWKITSNKIKLHPVLAKVYTLYDSVILQCTIPDIRAVERKCRAG